ncbi:Protein of unknown function [Actinokineospora alba]|uniref:DUF742 domain-containing protein n=1 Tax=Actinokineospora alba TaxID=504798 RepID=A0A1H0LUE2_9PSEU|nr:DUF742 domain-containing protein [Actinokineospora alba]TDP67452.1 uncharacterized protein DUF742 [Actinokineospora alba]SDI96216.1 Protein of unknown function [Actinokineospora alba]SDO71530.1 Protein of unknown function [Actinokineospora alba]
MRMAVNGRRQWFDDAAGPVVRPYAITGGRTRVEGIELDVATLVVSVQPEVHARHVDAESARLLRVCEYPQSVAEAAAGLRLPLRVVKVLLADLIQRQYVMYRAGWNATAAPDVLTMQKVLDGLRAL